MAKKKTKKLDPNFKKIDEFIASSEKNTNESTKALEEIESTISSKLAKIGCVTLDLSEEDSKIANLALISFVDLACHSESCAMDSIETLWDELGYSKSAFTTPIAARNAIAFYKNVDEIAKETPENVSTAEFNLAQEYEHEHEKMCEIAAGKHEISHAMDLFLILDNMYASVSMTAVEFPEIKDMSGEVLGHISDLWTKLAASCGADSLWKPGDLTLRASHVASQIMNANKAIMMAAKESVEGQKGKIKKIKYEKQVTKLTDMFDKYKKDDKKELLD